MLVVGQHWPVAVIQLSPEGQQIWFPVLMLVQTFVLAQHAPLTQVWSVSQQTLLQQVPEQQLLPAVQALPAAEQTQVPPEQTPEQQSLLLVHPESVFAIQATQVEVVASQTSPEQQSLWDKQP
jgi:hypothetical protein